MTDDPQSVVDPGFVRFYDASVPPLEVGDYVINAAQKLTPDGAPIDESHATSQAFSIQGPRFSLPPEDIFSSFPPPGAGGAYDQFLPHIVLTQRHLPWERNVFGATDPAQQPPWLALLVFGADVSIDDQPELLDPALDGYQTNAVRAGTLTADMLVAAHTTGTVAWPQLTAEWYEDDPHATSVSVIDVSTAAFRTLMPRPQELRFLAHARQVNPNAKDESVLRVAGNGWYSVVVANRLAAGRSIAHLVSLEGLTSYMEDSSSLDDFERVRLISLAGWSFTCVPDAAGGTFAAITRGLVRDARNAPRSTAFALPVPAGAATDDTTTAAAGALARGYVPLQYDARGGEQTFAFYRGPLTPEPVPGFVRERWTAPGERDAAWAPFGTASAALVYDATHGTFDVSYAVAWETGRTLALADAAFSQGLLDWQRDGHVLIDTILERQAQIAALSGLDLTAPGTEEQLLELLAPYAVTRDFVEHLITDLGPQLVPAPGSNAPPAPTSAPAYPDLPSEPAMPASLSDLLQVSVIQQAIRTIGGQALDDLANWLARRQLLVGVPFETLVAHPELLPPESVRFFHLDPNWCDVLLEGALSIGIESSRDRLYQDLMKDLIWDTTETAIQGLRTRLLADSGATPPDLEPLDQPRLAGMLLRSGVVAGWPGLEVRAYAGALADGVHPDLGKVIPPLRIDRLGADILLCLWPAIPTLVTVDEPHEGVCFGFEDPPFGQQGRRLYLRSLDAEDYGLPLGSDEQMADGSDAYMIDPDASGVIDSATRVLNVTTLRAKIADALPTLANGEKLTADDLTVRDLAVQLIKVPEQAVFAPPTRPAG